MGIFPSYWKLCDTISGKYLEYVEYFTELYDEVVHAMTAINGLITTNLLNISNIHNFYEYFIFSIQPTGCHFVSLLDNLYICRIDNYGRTSKEVDVYVKPAGVAVRILKDLAAKTLERAPDYLYHRSLDKVLAESHLHVRNTEHKLQSLDFLVRNNRQRSEAASGSFLRYVCHKPEDIRKGDDFPAALFRAVNEDLGGNQDPFNFRSLSVGPQMNLFLNGEVVFHLQFGQFFGDHFFSAILDNGDKPLGFRYAYGAVNA